MLLPKTLLPLILLLAPTLADQATLQSANSALSQALTSLSSLFLDHPSPSASAKPSFCCGPDCPPSACDINYMIPTDLGYAFPSPTPTSAPPNLKLPCCHANCPDGACRTTPLKASQRPILTQPPGDKGASENIIIGCCATCKACDQVFTSTNAATITATSNSAKSQITASPSLDDAIAKDMPGPGRNEKFPGFSFGSQITEICLGCGTCTPCDRVRLATWVEFYPNPNPTPTAVHAGPAGVQAESTGVPVVGGNGNGKADSVGAAADAEGEAEPTIYLADEIVDAVNGQNQDVLPIIIQTGNSTAKEDTDNVLSAASKAILGSNTNANDKSDSPAQNLRTLLAAIDLKLSENYISRRLLKRLGRLDEVKSAPTRTAYMGADLEGVGVEGTVVLDFVVGTPGGEGEMRLVKGVRFNVHGVDDHGSKDEEAAQGDDNGEGVFYDARESEIVLGSVFLREVNALTVHRGIRGVVQEGVRVVGAVHLGGKSKRKAALGDEGEEAAGEGGREGEGHDEL